MMDVLKHFGYEGLDGIEGIGIWPNDGTAIDRLRNLPEAIKVMGADTRKIRVVFDYDPDFPKAIIQIFGVETADLK